MSTKARMRDMDIIGLTVYLREDCTTGDGRLFKRGEAFTAEHSYRGMFHLRRSDGQKLRVQRPAFTTERSEVWG